MAEIRAYIKTRAMKIFINVYNHDKCNICDNNDEVSYVDA